MNALEFLAWVLPESGHFFAVVAKEGASWRHIPSLSHKELAEQIRQYDAKGETVYFATASYKAPHIGTDLKKKYRVPENLSTLKAFFLDIDCGEDKAAEGKGYADQATASQELKKFGDRLGLPKPLIVDSGRGLHAYWTLDRTLTPDVWKPLAEGLKVVTKHLGLLADPSRTADPASILRPVGSHNRKDKANPKLVRVIDAGETCSVAKFKAAIESAYAESMSQGTKQNSAVIVNGAARALANDVATLSDDPIAHLGPTPTWVDAADVSANTLADIRPRPLETPREVARVRSMLVAIDAGCDRATWMQILFGLKWTKWTCAEDLARQWSKRSDKYVETDFVKVWESGDPDRPNSKTIGAVAIAARQVGWVEPVTPVALATPVTPAVTATQVIPAAASATATCKTGEPGEPVRLTRVYQTCNDVGNADRLLRKYGQDLRFVFEERTWLYWDQNRWNRDDRGQIAALAEQVAREIYLEAARQEDTNDAKTLATHAGRSMMSGRVAAMIDLAKNRSGVVVTANELDANRWLIQVKNGVIDLRTNAFRSAQREDLLTKCANVKYDGAATCPVWVSFIDAVTCGDTRLADFLQRAVGYALTGETTEQCFFFLYGRGANGKSTFVNTLRELMGGYAAQVQPEILMQSRGTNTGEANPQLVNLKGRRMLVACETEEGMRLSESLVKQLTGGDAISARPLYGNPITFVPEGKFFVSGNYRPIVRGDDYGIWRRLILVPFDVTFSPDKQDKDLPHKLRAEIPGILNWALEGVRKYRSDGLNRPSRIAQEVETYRDDMDVVGQWLDDHCVTGNSHKVKAKDLYADYFQWTTAAGQTPVSQMRLAERLKDRGFRKVKSDGTIRYVGIRLRTHAELRAIDVGADRKAA